MIWPEIEIWQYGILLFSYLVGSFPTGYLVGKYLYQINLFEHGSKNVGATNALRILGKKAGASVLLIDAIKGAIPILVANHLFNLSFNWCLSAGFLAIFGHTFSPFIRFRGGKGVATSAGTFLALIPTAFCASLTVFLVTVFCTRYISLGSLLASVTLPIACWIFYPDHTFLWPACTALSAFIVFKHRSNIIRLLQRQENKVEWSQH